MNPRIFISYSWTPVLNKERTIKLAERLVENGVDVVIDVWDLKEGQDKYKFMEKMVNSPDIEKVLIICNKGYKEKADKREGGVGTESTIISDEVYSNAEQTKFIPIIFENDENGKAYKPSYLSSRIYIDLSDEEFFEVEYENLLRNIYNKPTYEKPKIGSSPRFLEEENVPTILSNKVNAIKSSLINERSYSISLIEEFFETFIENLNDYQIDISSQEKEIDEKVLERIDDLWYCQEDFTDLVRIVLKYSIENIILFHRFFEKLLQFVIEIEDPNATSETLGHMKNEHYHFLMYALFISISGILLENEKYNELFELLLNPYTVYNENIKEYINLGFPNLNNGSSSLNKYRIQRLQKRNVNEVSRVIRDRTQGLFREKDYISEVDAILYYISCFNTKDNYTRIWFPHTCDKSYIDIKILKKIKSLNHFNRFKVLLGVNDITELSSKIEFIVSNKIDRIERFHYGIEYVSIAFKVDNIGSMP